MVGHQFTSERGRGTAKFIETRLGRALVNDVWFQFPMARLYNLEGTPSDHSPILLDPKKVTRFEGQRKKFRFENAWILKSMCFHLVKDNWENNHGLDNQHKIQQCAEKLDS